MDGAGIMQLVNCRNSCYMRSFDKWEYLTIFSMGSLSRIMSRAVGDLLASLASLRALAIFI